MSSRVDEGVPESVLRDLYPERFSGPEAAARAEIDRLQDALAKATRTPAPSLGEDVVGVSRDDAIGFLEHAFRNIDLPPLSASEDIEDIRDGLAYFIRTRLAALSSMRPVQEEGGGEDGPVAWRWRYVGFYGGALPWAVRQSPVEAREATEALNGIEVEPLYLRPSPSEASPPSLGVEELREALIECGRAVGCLLTDQVSNEFLMLVPAEIKAKIEALSRVSGGV